MSVEHLEPGQRLCDALAARKWADVVAVPGNPLQDIHVMERPVFVMKNGYVYKSATMTSTLP